MQLVAAQPININNLSGPLAPGARSNDRFSGWNIFGMAVGGTLLVLVLIGDFIGDE